MNNILYILLGAMLILLGYVTPRAIGRCFLKYHEIKNAKKARFCHYCEQAFVDIWEEDFQYCPYCARKLKTIDDESDERSTRLIEEPLILSAEDLLKLKNLRHNNDKKD